MSDETEEMEDHTNDPTCLSGFSDDVGIRVQQIKHRHASYVDGTGWSDIDRDMCLRDIPWLLEQLAKVKP